MSALPKPPPAVYEWCERHLELPGCVRILSGATEPMVPSWVFDLAVLCLILVPFLAMGAWAMWEHRRERRRQRQRQHDRLVDAQISAGMRSAWRRGWIQDGDQ